MPAADPSLVTVAVMAFESPLIAAMIGMGSGLAAVAGAMVAQGQYSRRSRDDR